MPIVHLIDLIRCAIQFHHYLNFAYINSLQRPTVARKVYLQSKKNPVNHIVPFSLTECVNDVIDY